jgi:ketosteroid isomerase-like protein
MTEPPAFFQEFKRAMFRADADALAEVVTDDFVWEMHAGATGDEPHGRVLHGPTEMAAETERRRREWSDVTYDDVDERMAGDDLIVQTFLVSGVDSRGERFAVRAVDLYPLRDGKVAAKRTYWKQPGPGPAR